MEFDQMESPAGSESDYDLDDFEAVEWPDENEATKTVVGELLTVIEEIGKYDSTAYLLENEEGEQIMVWGNGSINTGFSQAEEAGLEEGDHVGIRKTGETYENEYGEYPQFEVRFQSA